MVKITLEDTLGVGYAEPDILCLSQSSMASFPAAVEMIESQMKWVDFV